MGLLTIGIAVTIIQLASSQNLTGSIKPKRTLSDQIYTHGETKPVVLLWDQTSNPQRQTDLQAAPSSDLRSFAKPLALVSVQQPIQVFEQENQKPIAAQQVLYEFQQTPTNAYSNVQLKQLFEPTSDASTESASDPTPHSSHFAVSSTEPFRNGFHHQQNNAFGQVNPQNNGFNNQPHGPSNHRNYPMASGYISAPAASESIATPVQHNLFTNHGQNTASFSYFNPSHPQPHQTQHISNNNNHRPNNNVGKYLYFNGKIVYQPNQLGQFSHIHHKQQSPSEALLQNQQKLNLPMINFMNRQYPQYPGGYHPIAAGSRNKAATPSYGPPSTQNHFKPPSPDQYQRINNPITTPPSKKKEAEQDDDEQAEEEDDDEERSESQKQEKDEEPEDNNDDGTENDEENSDDEDHHSYEQEFEHDLENDHEDNDEDDYDKYYQESKRKAKLKHIEDDENDEDDRDNSRRASKPQVTYNKTEKKNKRQKDNSPKRYVANENYGYKEKYSTSSKFRSPSKKGGKENKYEKPKKHYKQVKYSKNKGRPKSEVLEGESKIIPIVQKQKIYKERWYTVDNDSKANGRGE